MFKKKYALVIKENNLMINFAVKLRRYSRSLEKILKQTSYFSLAYSYLCSETAKMCGVGRPTKPVFCLLITLLR